jgi:sensor histidine kinase YesM
MTLAGMMEKIYGRRYVRIGLHIGFWILFLLVRFYLTSISFNVYRGFPAERIFLLNAGSTFYAAMFYYGLVVLIVWFRSSRKKYLLLFSGLLLLFVTYTILDTISEMAIIRSCRDCMSVLAKENLSYFNYIHQHIINILFQRIFSLGAPLMLLFMLSIPLCIRLVMQAFRHELASSKLAKENLQLELNFLKAQLNPHFLFNCLNNIYGLILAGDEKRSSGLVARLSEVLRYILYESDQHMMPVEREVKLAEDYIELEKIRLNHTKVEFHYHSDNTITSFAPLMLMPLIENAFKFGADQPGAFIRMSWIITGNTLSFSISNTLRPQGNISTHSGIGLANFKKRMELYYAGKYRYHVDSAGDTYSANLMIHL